MSSFDGKSPITYLFELCLKKGLTPVFELERSSGPVHQQIFEIKVTAGDYIGRGSGSRKKKAKHLAALEAVNLMLGTPNENNSTFSISDRESLGTGHPINPVSELQEMTQKNRLPLPTYEFDMSPGPPEVPSFTCTVRLLHMVDTGNGKSKKIAKREAASAMLNQLKVDDLTTKFDEALKSLKDEFRIGDMKSAYQELQKKSYCGESNGIHCAVSSHSVPTYHNMLQELADESKFEVTYVDLLESTYTGWCQCIVQLSIVPVVVCHGTGLTMDEAHTNAALNALLYIHCTYYDGST